MAHDEYDSLEDLVFCRSFRDWVLKGNTPEAGFWSGWQTQHPEKRELIIQARAVIHALDGRVRSLPAEAVDQELTDVMRRLEAGLFEADGSLPADHGRGYLSRFSGRVRGVTVVFCILCLIAAALFFYANRYRQDAFRFFLAGSKSGPMHRETGGLTGNQVIVLPDGSKVRLDAGSQLYYPDKLSGAGKRRAVFLDGGGAVFTIAPDAAHPFYVYTSKVVIKVLGTSLRVTASGSRILVSGDRLDVSNNEK